jgi:hypothetical protein
MFSIDDLNAIKACSNAHEFEVVFAGQPTGVFLSVLGDESEQVAVETAALLAAERARANTLGDKYEADNAKLGKQLAALRINAWRGIKEEFSRENATKLCLSNTAIADQVIQHSKNLGNFIKL